MGREWLCCLLLALMGYALAVRARLTLRTTVAGVLVLALLVAPPVQAQLGLSAFFAAVNTILTTINQTLGSLLDTANGILGAANNSIRAFTRDLQQLWSTIIYPRQAIESAWGTVRAMVGQFRALLSSVFNISALSAQLAHPVRLETLARNRSAGDLAAVESAYRQVFRAVPPATEVHSVDRDVIDTDDATAIASLRTLKSADAAADQTIAASMLLEDEAGRAAPGTAAYVSASGTIAALQSQAVMQQMLAAQLRQEAVRLAHTNVLRKRTVMATHEMRRGVGGLLTTR